MVEGAIGNGFRHLQSNLLQLLASEAIFTSFSAVVFLLFSRTLRLLDQWDNKLRAPQEDEDEVVQVSEAPADGDENLDESIAAFTQ